jgi:hypothetical protein
VGHKFFDLGGKKVFSQLRNLEKIKKPLGRLF